LNIGDHVIYRQEGICRILDRRMEDFGGMGAREYYILVSAFNPGVTTYVPVTAESMMRPILSKEEIDGYIRAVKDVPHKWINESKTRHQEFTALLTGGDTVDILWLVKVLSLKRIEMQQQKKTLFAGDAKLLAIAEKLITEEFAFVLGIDRSKVIDYIIRKAA